MQTKSEPPKEELTCDFNTAIEWPTLSEIKSPINIDKNNDIPIVFNKVVESTFDLIADKVEKISLHANSDESNAVRTFSFKDAVLKKPELKKETLVSDASEEPVEENAEINSMSKESKSHKRATRRKRSRLKKRIESEKSVPISETSKEPSLYELNNDDFPDLNAVNSLVNDKTKSNQQSDAYMSGLTSII